MECSLLPGQWEGPEDLEASQHTDLLELHLPRLDGDEQGVQAGEALQIGLVVLFSVFLPRP